MDFVLTGQVADRAPERVAHTVFVEAFLPHDGKSMLDAISDHGREEELRQIAENGGRWPAPSVTDLEHEKICPPSRGAGWRTDLSTIRHAGHPSRPSSSGHWQRSGRPTSRARSGGHSVSDDVAAMRKGPNLTFRTLEAGHWPMVPAPEELVALLAEVESEHGRP